MRLPQFRDLKLPSFSLFLMWKDWRGTGLAINRSGRSIFGLICSAVTQFCLFEEGGWMMDGRMAQHGKDRTGMMMDERERPGLPASKEMPSGAGICLT